MVSIKLYHITLFVLATICYAQESYTNEETGYILFKDYDNVTRVINLQEDPDYTVLQRSTTQDKYLLFTRKNPTIPQTLTINNAISILSSNYDPAVQTVVIVHGWGGNQNSQINPTVRDAYLNKEYANIIVVDWSRMASSNYVTATLGVPEVGRTLGRFLAFLRATTGASLSNMHLIGFSLGAHVVGCAGAYLYGRVARITGLDPAGPLWGILNSNRLTSSDAVYVEAIHTDEALLGTVLRSGHADFYPNGGSSQPGCSSNSCSHNRSWQLFAATVIFNHLTGRKCRGALALEWNFCSGESLPMGNDNLNKRGSGQYRLNTEGIYPYWQK